MSPPLTREAFRAALEKGQGRAWLHVQDHGTAGRTRDPNPCSSCRARALKRLIQRGAAPESLVRECPHDADGEARELAQACL